MLEKVIFTWKIDEYFHTKLISLTSIWLCISRGDGYSITMLGCWAPTLVGDDYLQYLADLIVTAKNTSLGSCPHINDFIPN